MGDEFRLLHERIERLELAVGDIRDRLRHCIQVAGRPQDAIALARGVAESLAKRIVEGIGIKPPGMLDACLKELERPEVMSRGLVPSEIVTILHMVRVMGNKATHDSMRIQPTEADVSLVLQSILRVVEWYFSAFERGPTLERIFVPCAAAGAPTRGPKRKAQARGRAFATRRKTVYEELWKRVEESHLKIRTDDVKEEDFSVLLRGINTYIFQNSVYLDEAVHELANTYLLLLLDVRRLVTEAGDEEAKRAFDDTGPLPPSALRRVCKLRELWENTDTVRAQLLGRVRMILDPEGTIGPVKKRWWRFW